MTKRKLRYSTVLMISPGNQSEHEIKMDVTYDFHPYRPAYTPRGEYAPIDPPEPEMAEVTCIDLMLDDKIVDCPDWLFELLTEDEFLQEDLIENAKETA